MDPILAKTLDRINSGLDQLRIDAAHQQRLATLGTIAALIAHEIKNILTPMRTYAQLALGAPDDPQLVRKALERAEDCGKRAGDIADAILGLAAASPDRESAKSAAGGADVAEAVDSAVQCLAQDLATDQVRLVVAIEPGLAAAIRPVSLQHVLLNLILNARTAMMQSGGELAIKASRSSWNTLIISVADSGRGMDQAQVDKLFTPFGSARSGGGAGLGMTVCKSLIEDADGEIQVTSTRDRGTCVTITLPIATPQSDSLRKSA